MMGRMTQPTGGSGQGDFWREWLHITSADEVAGKSDADLLGAILIELTRIRTFMVWVWLLIPAVVFVLFLASIDRR